MVDFVKKLAELRAWKVRKAKIGCDCTAEHRVTCYQWKHDTEQLGGCKCKCHDSKN